MNTTITVGIIGATGLVGSEIGQCLSESNISQDVEFKLFASADSEGEVYNIRGQEVVVGVLGEDAYKGLNVAIFALKQDLAKKEIKKALKNGAYVIDTSTAYQADGDGKLVHSTLNPECITADTKHYVIPSPAACQIAVVTKKLLSLNKIKNISTTTIASVSSAGKVALDELWSQTISVCNHKAVTPEAFAHQIAFNVTAQVDTVLENGFTKEESSIQNEVSILTGLNCINTFVRVPVFMCYGTSATFYFDKAAPSVEEACKALGDVKEVALHTDSEEPLQFLDSAGSDSLHIGRIRTLENSLSCWIVSDNLRQGAAIPAVKVLEILLKVMV